MIKKFVDKFIASKEVICADLALEHPGSYRAILDIVLKHAGDFDENHPAMDDSRVTEIDDGDYQGTILFVIGESGYQPSTYYATAVSYGSCGGCDTLQRIRDSAWDNAPTPAQVNDYYTLALHLAQGMRQIAGYAMTEE